MVATGLTVGLGRGGTEGSEGGDGGGGGAIDGKGDAEGKIEGVAVGRGGIEAVGLGVGRIEAAVGVGVARIASSAVRSSVGATLKLGSVTNLRVPSGKRGDRTASES
jgi:hypothetical protein